ncbi:MAG: zinc-binding dehydrogenase [Myxococcota bacterium]
MTLPSEYRRIVSRVGADGTLTLSIDTQPLPEPREHEVLIRVEASPINPSDLGVLLTGADKESLRATGSADAPEVQADIPAAMLRGLGGRTDKAIGVGNEGAGEVVAAGSSEAAQGLIGKTVGAFGGEMYGEYRCLPAAQCIPLAEGTTAAEGASCFVNPLTALGMVETMRREGHTALVHTAAASNLGQMLQKICIADGIDLVNIVRRPEQAELLRGLGAKYVCDSSRDSFMKDLVDALADTGATLAFDATGGGTLTSQILTAMEGALNRNATGHSQYGSTTHKQVYVYGGLDTSETRLSRGFGMAWGIGGWLLPNFLAKIGADAMPLYARVATEIKTTFASHYTKRVSLREALDVDVMRAYGRQATGEKVLIEPNRF